MKNIFCLLIICHITSLTSPAPKAVRSRQKLMNDLLSNYDLTIRPVQFDEIATNVTLNPALHGIVETDEAMATIILSLWNEMTWTDEYLTWDPEEYDGIDKIRIPSNKIWLPDVIIVNLIRLKIMIADDKNLATIDFDGTVTAIMDQIATIHCDYQIANFPFDVQNCTLVLSTWVTGIEEINLLPNMKPNLQGYSKNEEWDLISFTSRCSMTNYTDLQMSTTINSNIYFDIVIQRKPMYYLVNFIVPSFIITTLAIIGVFSPFTDSGGREEKVTMGLTTLLTMAVILLIVTEQMPKSSEGMPLLGLFVLIEIILAASASISAVFIMYEHSKWTTGHAVPHWILTVTRLRKSEMIQRQKWELKRKMKEELSQPSTPDDHSASELHLVMKRITEVLDEHEKSKELRLTWNRAMRRLDLFLMIIFISLNIILTVVILVRGFGSLVK